MAYPIILYRKSSPFFPLQFPIIPRLFASLSLMSKILSLELVGTFVPTALLREPRKIFSLLFCFVFCNNSLSQLTQNVKGQVTDRDGGTGIPGVVVMLK